MDISADKKIILKKLLTWYKEESDQKSFITLGGYAGTGKTTLIAILRKLLYKQDEKLKVAFAAYTGKAARVLKTYLKINDVLYKKDSVGTIHSLIYSPIENERHEIVGWKEKDEVKFDLIIIDEASMVDQRIWRDLLSYKVPIIAIGDHGQLPPVQGSFNLMENPELKLETIHRQAENNPIIKLSIMARETGKIPIANYGNGVRKLSKFDPDTQEILESYFQSFNHETMILCGYNNSRIRLNNYLRQILGFESAEPEAGDRLICLRNNHKKGILNGMLGTLQRINKEGDDFYHLKIDFDDEDQIFEGLAVAKQFGASRSLNYGKEFRQLTLKADLFDFAYALTVHKAQGSQESRVIVFEERFKQMSDDDWKKWLYTAITRAEEELIIVGE